MLLLHLPDELLLQIVSILDIKTLFLLVRTCRYLRSLCDPETRTGGRLWQLIRDGEGWPDPSPIGITDYSFCKAYYSRGCHQCSDHPRVRNVRWEYGTMKLCKDCFEQVTIPEYRLKQLGVSPGRYEHLLSIRSGLDPLWGPVNGNRCYLIKSIPKAAPSSEEAHASRAHRDAVELFKEALWIAEDKRKEANRVILCGAKNARIAAAHVCLEEHMPELTPAIWGKFTAFVRFTQRSTPFTKASGTLLIKAMRKEYKEKAHVFIRDQTDALTKQVFREEPFISSNVWPYQIHILHFPAYLRLCKAYVEREHLPTFEEVRDELLGYIVPRFLKMITRNRDRVA